MSEPLTKATDLLSRDMIRGLTALSDLRGAASLASDWAVIVGCFTASWLFPHPVVWVAATVVLGSRQLALAVLMHECAHRSLFRSRTLNDYVGRWLCAAPIWADVDRYRSHHQRHHSYTGTERDPDLGLVEPFPTTRASLLRKFARDLSGLGALRRIAALFAMDIGLLEYSASTTVHRGPPLSPLARLVLGAQNLWPVVLTNLALFTALSALAHPALYVLWLFAWMTTYGFFLRVRAIAEHACTERAADPLRNTRTTTPGALSAWLFAPHQVHYHLEHHLLPTVPHYRLAEMHRELCARGVFSPANLAPGYLSVMRQVTGG